MDEYVGGGSMLVSQFFFFFQAEDGIRDYKVTGVQTCALPILFAVVQIGSSERKSPCITARMVRAREGCARPMRGSPESAVVASVPWTKRRRVEIGRASCRERV